MLENNDIFGIILIGGAIFIIVDFGIKIFKKFKGSEFYFSLSHDNKDSTKLDQGKSILIVTIASVIILSGFYIVMYDYGLLPEKYTLHKLMPNEFQELKTAVCRHRTDVDFFRRWRRNICSILQEGENNYREEVTPNPQN